MKLQEGAIQIIQDGGDIENGNPNHWQTKAWMIDLYGNDHVFPTEFQMKKV